MVEHKIDFNALQWQSPGPDARFKAAAEDGKRMRLMELDKGFQDQIWCEAGHVGYVLEGEMEIDFGGEVTRFKTGDGIYIPGGRQHKHKAHVMSDKVRVILIEEC
jgi:quercetin dioxygenase-like cupin family protein